jgi:hypothetical protein
MSRNGFVQPLVLATVLAAGFGIVWGLVSLWAAEVGAYVALDPRPSEMLIFQTDGTPRVAHEVGRRGERVYRDLEGNAVPEPDDQTGWLNATPLPAALPERLDGGTSWGQRIRSFADGRVPATYWYLVSDGRPDGTGYFVGYDSKSKARVGYLGTAGFREGPPTTGELLPFAGAVSGPRSRVFSLQGDHQPTEHPERPPTGRAPRGAVSPGDVYVFGRGGRLYHADLPGRRVELVLDDPQLRSAALVAGVHDPAHGTPCHVAARTDEAVLVLDARGQLLRRYPIPETLRGRTFLFGETTAGEAVECWSSPNDEFATRFDHRICWARSDGQTREANVTLAARGGVRTLVLVGAGVVPSPVGLAGLVATYLPRLLLDSGRAASYDEALQLSLGMAWPALALAQLLAVGLAVLCYRRQMRYGAGGTERLLWPLFVLLFGLPGWVGYRFGRSWPVLESCPSCDVGVPRDREACVRCEAEFPPAALKGTEVFA